MEQRKRIKILAAAFLAIVLLMTLCGCQKGKKFDSAEAMVTELTGVYAGTDAHAGERIVIDGKTVRKFNIDSIFSDITQESFFWEHFPNEDWEKFDLESLLKKGYIEMAVEPVVADTRESMLSGLWVDKNGVLFTQPKEGYALTKITSESTYPTAEMQEKFTQYLTYLQQYEQQIVVAEAQSNLAEAQEALDTALLLATSANSAYKKSTASAETIAKCAFDSLKAHMKEPGTATLDSYAPSPQYDPYGRVCTVITVTTHNGFGRYITEDVYVVLQSCSASGEYTVSPGGMHYTKKEEYLNMILLVNSWDEEPDIDEDEEFFYNEAIKRIKDEEYWAAIFELEEIGEYKSSVKLMEACIAVVTAQEYKTAIDTFDKGAYTDAIEGLSFVIEYNEADYLRAERVITLCKAALGGSSETKETLLFGTLDTSKVWKMGFELYDASYSFHYLFEEDGSFYLVLSEEFYPWDGGKGIYNIRGNVITLSIFINGDSCVYSYEFDPQTNQLTYVSGTPILEELAETDDVYLLEEDDALDADKIKQLAQSFINVTAEQADPEESSSVSTDVSYNAGSTGGNSVASTGNAGNTAAVTNTASCDHTYADATCTAPSTCTKCGATTGSKTEHTWEYTSCTTEKACPGCGQELFSSTPGHKWKEATCTEPACCITCKETDGKALGHAMLFTKCSRSSCDYTDFSCITGAYTNIGGYGVPVGTTNMVDLGVTSVSINDSGILKFTCNGKPFALTIKQNKKSDKYTAYFDCYLNGALVEGVTFRACNEMYDNRIHLDKFLVDDCWIYLNATW